MGSVKSKPLLSITIPTYNRSQYLSDNLNRLNQELRGIELSCVEIIVSDNASIDDTENIVRKAINDGLPLHYVKNAENIGSDENFAQCFNLARGKYVLIMGDDDLFSRGALDHLIMQLKMEQNGGYGVVFLRPYAFDLDPDKEYPHGLSGSEVYSPAEFIVKISHLMTFISSLVINKELLRDIDAKRFCGGQLVQVHLALRSALASNKNLVINRYMVACRRSSSPDFDYGKVFVLELGRILDQSSEFGLRKETVLLVERKMLLTLLPYLALRQRLANAGDPCAMSKKIESRYGGRFIFDWGLRLILVLPKWPAIIWGSFIVLFGRLMNGDGRRAIWFLLHRLRRYTSLSKKCHHF